MLFERHYTSPREKAAERAAHRTSAGTILAEYDLYTWVITSGSDCQQLRVSPGADTSTGHELLIAEHGIVRTEMVLPAGAAEPYSSLSYDDIASVLPIEQETGHQWIPLRTRSGSCVYLELLQPGPGALSPADARALILAHLTPTTAPAVSGPEP